MSICQRMRSRKRWHKNTKKKKKEEEAEREGRRGRKKKPEAFSLKCPLAVYLFVICEPTRKRSAVVLHQQLFLHHFNRATKSATHLNILFNFPLHTLLSILYIQVVSQQSSNITRRWQHNLANLRPIGTSSSAPLSFSLGLWNCQSNRTSFWLFPYKLHLVSWAWVRPGFVQKTQQPWLLRVAESHSLSLTPLIRFGGVGGTGMLISNNWKYSNHSPLWNNSFVSHTITVTVQQLTISTTHKPGNQLDWIYTCNCIADNILVTPLHISDLFFITFNLHVATCVAPTPLPVTFRQNLCSLSPSNFSSLTHFSSLDVNAATDTFCSTLKGYSQSCGLELHDSRLDSDSSPKSEDLRLDFDNNDSRLDLDLSPVTRQVLTPCLHWTQVARRNKIKWNPL